MTSGAASWLSVVVLLAGAVAPAAAQLPGGAATIRGKAGESEIVITTMPRLAGAIHSLVWNGREFIDSADHGRQLQSASNFDAGSPIAAETYNPTEAGSRRDGAGAKSSSRLLHLVARENVLQTTTQMAFWLAPGEASGGVPAKNRTVLSHHLLTKRVTIGTQTLPHVVQYDVTFSLPVGERHEHAVFEAVTGYMPAEFSRFWRFNPEDEKLEPLRAGPIASRASVATCTRRRQSRQCRRRIDWVMTHRCHLAAFLRASPMLAKLRTFSLYGIEALPVEVEVDVSPGALPKTTLVGLPEAAVKESTHRIERALANSGFLRPMDRVVINLAPAELPKQAASFDLPIALGMLAGSGQISSELFEKYAVVGELSLEGKMRPVKGALSMSIATRELPGIRGIMVPTENAAEAAVVEGVEVIPVSSLAEAVGFFTGQIEIEPAPPRVEEYFQQFSHYDIDFADVRGQEMAKRAITIAAAGHHNLLMVGPPGSGKTMLAKRVPTILPPLTSTESIETTRIYSALGRLPPGQPLMAQRPFRSPHHTISNAGLVGGGSVPTPGEISLSHHGVLFLDELPEFNRPTLEVLRQPLEDGNVTISRALNSTTFPAHFMLIAALNPCPCGYRGDPRRQCHCTVPQIERYMAKISGPLLDRIDIHIEVPAVPFKELAGNTKPGTSSESMKGQVLAARAIQAKRFTTGKAHYNGLMSTRQIRQYCTLTDDCLNLLKNSVAELGLSARAHDKILRVTRTIADMDGSETITSTHISEAINYRMLDRGLWT